MLALDIDTDAAIEDVLQGGGRIFLVLLLAFIAVKLIQRLISPLLRVAIREQMEGQPEIEVTKRIETLTAVVYHTTVFAISVIALVTILPEFGINAGPLIAGLGLIGLAVGFGAQNLVRDVINGLEILTENQYAVGDFIAIRTGTGGTAAGIVEDINLRRTVMRDFDGNVHFISHGQIDITTNHTRGFSRVAFNVSIANSSDVDRVFGIVDETGAALAADPAYADLMRSAPHAAGVERLGDASLEVRVEGEVSPGAQWRVGSELRRRLKLALDAAEIRSKD